MRLLCLIALLSAPSCTAEYATGSSAVLKAVPYIGKTELGDRQELIDFLDVDPVNTEWCAAFVNSVLEESNIPSNKDHQHPLMARAFLDWGLPVEPENIQPGDIVVFPRGADQWKGHVGFYVKTVQFNDTIYYSILGGNQSNRVSIELYKQSSALGIRRSIHTDKYTTQEEQINDR